MAQNPVRWRNGPRRKNWVIMMKTYLLNLTATLLSLGMPIATHASALSDWVDQVNTRIDQVAVEPTTLATGIVEVRFHRGPDGRPTDVTVIGGNPRLGYTARRSLARVGVLPPLPAQYGPETGIVLRMVVGDGGNTTGWQRAVRQMQLESSVKNAQLAARHEDNAQLALAAPR